MKPPTRTALRLAATATAAKRTPTATRPLSVTTSSSLIPLSGRRRRQIHSTPPAAATVSPVHGQGPPPGPPQPAADSEQARLERRRKQAELLQKAQDIRAAAEKPPSSRAAEKNSSNSSSSKKAVLGAGAEEGLPRRRFWRDAHVREVDGGGGGGGGAWEVHLDARPLRHPATKRAVRVPRSKPLLAAALALEWDLLASPHHATRHHLIPLTSLVCRAIDIREDDDDDSYGEEEAGGMGGLRAGVVGAVMRYFDTDSLLCWAPPPRFGLDDPADGGTISLRETQRRAAEGVVGFLTTRVWPGLAIEPSLGEDGSILPRPQPPGTRQAVEGWVAGLDAWELAGLERAALAGKSLLGAARLLVEWSEGGAGAGVGGEAASSRGVGEGAKFGVEEAARLASIEVGWQINRWGEVEDTHDVEREDLRRQLGSVVLLVSGTGTR